MAMEKYRKVMEKYFVKYKSVGTLYIKLKSRASGWFGGILSGDGQGGGQRVIRGRSDEKEGGLVC